MSKTAIIPGSLAAVARQEGQSLAESFLAADAIVIVDVSGSMDARDVDPAPAPVRASWDDGPSFSPPNQGRTRYQAACEELEKLQQTIPGKIAVVAFSNGAQFVWGGHPPFLSGGTDMVAALQFIRPADGCGMTLVLISDGGPNDPAGTLAEARRFTSPIQTVYVGPKGGEGEAFLAKLAAATGGTHQTKSIPQLAASIAGLLGTGKAA